ncbi:MAG: hypothetical protein J7J93_02795 [Candidatus Aenigmarchaeota archaeon]|nr:hypothetical protein [Candidatus Aenigmarchaeota archaeon]
MLRGRPSRPDLKKVFIILKALEKINNWVWIRELSRKTKIPLSTLHYYLEKHLNQFLEEINTEQFLNYEKEKNYPKLRLIKLKDGVTTEKAIKWLKIKDKL